ncbi:hypothetical protein AB0L71_10220 [Streptomyces sp. NPDC052052]|uniref:hypothetical protein n=1 Tax=Streptomyces sp. NPDC052052 TaxID=3154756 RepID=UPI0034129EBC
MSSGGVFKVNTTTPILRFTVDTNGEGQVTGTYEITDTATGDVVTTLSAAAVAANSTSQVKVPAGKLTTGRTYSFRTTSYDGSHYANGWSGPVLFTVGTSWTPTAARTPWGWLANTCSGAADIAAAASSGSSYAAISVTEENVVSVLWDGANGAIDVQNELMPNKLTIPAAGSDGTQVGGNVVYASTGSVDAVVQPTVDGGSRTLNILKDSSAPHDYETSFVIPAGMSAVTYEDGSVSLYADGDEEAGQAPVAEAAGFFDAPWAKDVNGSDVATCYQVVGDRLVQHVEFDANSAFPIVIGPAWWSTTQKITSAPQ